MIYTYMIITNNNDIYIYISIRLRLRLRLRLHLSTYGTAYVPTYYMVLSTMND